MSDLRSRIDRQGIADQMNISAEYSSSFLDPRTGEVNRIQDQDLNPKETQRLHLIPNVPSQDIYLWMVEFSETVSDRALRKRLLAALSQISAQWKFRNVLYHCPEESEKWQSFKKMKLLASAEEWVRNLPPGSPTLHR